MISRIFGFLTLLIAPVGLAIGAFGSSALRHDVAENGMPCPFRLLTGVRCPFCGMTHATLALGHGDFHSAFSFHPLAPLVLAMTVWASLMLLLDRQPRYKGRPVGAAVLLGLTAVVWAVNLIAHAA